MLKALAIYWRRPIFMVVVDTGARKYPITRLEDPDAQPGETQVRLPMLWVFTQTDGAPGSINGVNNFDARPFSRELIHDEDVVLYRTRLNSGPWIDHVRPCLRLSIPEMLRSKVKMSIISDSCTFAGEHWKVKRGRADRNSSAARLSGVFKLLGRNPNHAFLAGMLLMGSERTDYLLDALGLQKRRDYICSRVRGKSEKLFLLSQHDSERLLEYLQAFHREMFAQLTRTRGGQTTRERVRHIIQDASLTTQKKRGTIAEVIIDYFRQLVNPSDPTAEGPKAALAPQKASSANLAGFNDQDKEDEEESSALDRALAKENLLDATEPRSRRRENADQNDASQDGLTKLLQAATTGGNVEKASRKRSANLAREESPPPRVRFSTVPFRKAEHLQGSHACKIRTVPMLSEALGSRSGTFADFPPSPAVVGAAPSKSKRQASGSPR
eukprot:scaffold79_cov259-Pinguiococcus_pyrenoidosus.AAC.10